ncbi:MAG: hypothetical protein J6Y97_08370 [Prevotella sp.]|nr:hypothetical protein [Prevotella sp.]
MERDQKNMSRRKFLQVSGSLMIGAAFAGVIGRSLWKLFNSPGDLFYDAKTAKRNKAKEEMANYVSPYRLTSGFIAPDVITALEVLDKQIVIATPNNILLYGLDGSLDENFAIRSDLRDMAVFAGKIYLLFASRVEVYDPQGNLLQEWNACSDDADYCSLTVFDAGVFVTDAQAKNICQYHLDGSLARFIESPKGFVVPSYSFGITNLNGSVFCSNPGRHQVEQYTAKGEFVASFGKSGIGAGEFSGCCNPVQITTTATGELLTSEKGLPRISCYASDGTFRSILLDDKALGGGHAAYDVRMMDNKLIVTGANKVSVFQYDNRRSAQTQCGSCTVDCPMKVIS